MVLSLLRLVDISGGVISIDDEDITTIPRNQIRKRLSCLTQEPFLFTNTIRLNADPLGESSDEDIVSALEKVGLWRIISNKVNPDGGNGLNPLNVDMEENFLSHGQRQLFCLARALLKKSTILILDEPTSRRVVCSHLALLCSNSFFSVDFKTDAQMQAVISSEFKNCTIMMIAHRLDSLLDFDTVAVLEKGQIAELGNPRLLLSDQGSTFYRMYHSGITTASD
jgi:ATP-binding cassette, subfamily C (CFTR/MRP), member 1